MKFNYYPSSVAFIDFEVQSAVDIARPRSEYMGSSTTKVLTCALSVDGVMHEFPAGSDFMKLAELTEGRTLVAHNAPYDAGVWDHVLKFPEREWFDTLTCARAG